MRTFAIAPADAPSGSEPTMTSSYSERAQTASRLAGCRVLIVDDNEQIRTLYRTALSLTVPDIGIATAGDGAEALRCARELKPDVVLMDLNMPEMDGLEATRRLKAGVETGGIRVIAISGMTYESASVLNAGCDGYLLKPATPDEVMREIVRVLGR